MIKVKLPELSFNYNVCLVPCRSSLRFDRRSGSTAFHMLILGRVSSQAFQWAGGWRTGVRFNGLLLWPINSQEIHPLSRSTYEIYKNYSMFGTTMEQVDEEDLERKINSSSSSSPFNPLLFINIEICSIVITRIFFDAIIPHLHTTPYVSYASPAEWWKTKTETVETLNNVFYQHLQ